jgi:hypothetical protein
MQAIFIFVINYFNKPFSGNGIGLKIIPASSASPFLRAGFSADRKMPAESGGEWIRACWRRGFALRKRR